MTLPEHHPNKHRVVLTFENGYGPSAKLICPESGCIGSEVCGICGRDVTDPESKPCYDCKGMNPAACWVKTWFDNLTPDELLSGSLTVEIDAEWDGDHMVAHIAGVVPKDAA